MRHSFFKAVESDRFLMHRFQRIWDRQRSLPSPPLPFRTLSKTMSDSPLTTEQVQKERVSRLLSACLDMALGTVWRVRESLWKDSFRQQGQSYESDREWHPGVSLRATPLTCVNEFIPMLHGSSGDHGPVIARGLSREKGPHYPTSFGGIVRPAKVRFRDANPRDPASVELEGRLIDRSPVSANLDKPRLSEAELAELRGWAEARNLL
jgi:hypothetical protein